MPKIKVTPEFAQHLKGLRINNKFTSKSLAEKISKSQAYITKLEKAEIKSLDFGILLDILSAFYKNDDKKAEEEWNIIMEKYNDSITISSKEIKERINEQNFDTVYRKIPMPDQLSKYILDQVNKLNISFDEFVDFINSNYSLKNIISENEMQKAEPNKWYLYNGEPIIIMKLDALDVSQKLHTNDSTFNYVTVQSMLVNLYILQSKPLDEAYKLASQKMNEFKFYSLQEKYHILSHAASNQERNQLLSEIEIQNNSYVNNIIRAINTISQLNIKYANSKLENITNNLKTDIGFTFAFLGINLLPLKDNTFDQKKAFLNDVEELIKKYSSIKQDKKDDIKLY